MTTDRSPRILATCAAALAAAALLAACSDDGESSSASGQAGASSEVADLPRGDEPVELDPAEFSAEITNRFWPLEAGTRWTYVETDEDGSALDVVVTATGETKEIANGITARVVRDSVTEDGKLIEDTFDWYAQDADGNVWYMGEDTAEFENGKLTTRAGSFEAGVDGALPGIIMPGEPEDGMQYRQEYLEGEAEDNGEILGTDEMADVPYGHFEGAVLTKDTIAIEPKVLEYKLYAPGVGQVMALGISGGGGQELLTDVERIGAKAARLAGTTPLGEPYP